MIQFNSNNNWHNENPDLNEITWQHDQLTLKPLSDQPFDILHSIAVIPSIAESFTTSGDDSIDIIDQPAQHDEEVEEEMEDIWTSSAPTTTTFNTLSWDTKNKHYPSFAQTQLAKKNIGTSFLTEAPISLFEPVIQSRSTSQDTVIYEVDLVKSLIQALVGLPSVHFFYNNSRGEFEMRAAHLRILGVSTTAIEPVLKEILAFGTKLRGIEYVAKTISARPEKYGLTGVAMACCLSELHLNMLQSINLIFEHQGQTTTVLKVYQYVNNLAAVTEKLYALFYSSQSTRIRDLNVPFGVDLINLLHAEIKQFNLVQSGNHALYRDICLTLLYYTSVPYTSMLSKWLGLVKDYSGLVDDPYNEFFITTHHHVQDILEKFEIRSNAKLPYFLNKDLAIYILRSGISLQLLKKTKPDHPIFNSSESMSLKCLLGNMESEEFTAKLETTCKYIQAYNSRSNPLIEDQPISLDEPAPNQPPQQDDTLMNNEMTLELPFLDATNPDLLKGDFTRTLNDLIGHQQLQLSNNFIPTLDTITHQSYMKPLQIWCPLLNESFMSSFLNQFKLQLHLSLLHNYFLFGNGTFVSGLKETFFKNGRISLYHKGRWPPRSYDLNMALRDLLLERSSEKEGEEEDLFTFSIREANESSYWLNPNAVEALDFLQLNYHASYPLNMLITPTILTKYNRIFTFLLQVLRASTVTKRMFEPLKGMTWFRSSTRDKIFRFRFELDQYMTTIQTYIHDTAIQNTWSRFMQHVGDMHARQFSDDYVHVIMEPHTFKEYHEHILDRILYQCFLKQSQLRILHVLLPILNDIIIFGVLLDDYTKTDVIAEDKLLMKCKKIFDQFQTHTKIFVRVLKLLEEKGSGRLSNILNSTKFHHGFNELYSKYEAKNGLDVFVQDLLIRLSLNNFYDQ